MSAIIVADNPPRAVRLVTKAYARLLLAGFALVPAYLIANLYLGSPQKTDRKVR